MGFLHPLPGEDSLPPPGPCLLSSTPGSACQDQAVPLLPKPAALPIASSRLPCLSSVPRPSPHLPGAQGALWSAETTELPPSSSSSAHSLLLREASSAPAGAHSEAGAPECGLRALAAVARPQPTLGQHSPALPLAPGEVQPLRNCMPARRALLNQRDRAALTSSCPRLWSVGQQKTRGLWAKSASPA